MAATDLPRVEHDLARALANLASRLAEAGRWRDAMGIASEGIAIRKRLVLANPTAQEPHLARELAILGGATANAGSRNEAKALITESVGILRRLAKSNPVMYTPDVAGLQIALAQMSMDTPAGIEQARAEITEAIRILEPLAEQGHVLVRMKLEAANEIQRLLGEPTRTQRCGTKADAQVTLSFMQAALGTTVQLRLTDPPRTVTARLPAGVHHGQRVRLRGQDRSAADGRSPGDLYMMVTVEPDEVFNRNGHNLTLTVPLTNSEADLGADIRIPLINGCAVTLRIPRRTADGVTFRVPSRGLHRADGAKGDLHVQVEITADGIDASARRADLIAKAASAWQAYASPKSDVPEADNYCVTE